MHVNGNCMAARVQRGRRHVVAVACCCHVFPEPSHFALWFPRFSMVLALVVPPATRAGMRAGRAGALAVATLSRGHFCRHHSAASGCAFAAQTCRVASSFEAATPTSAIADANCARRCRSSVGVAASLRERRRGCATPRTSNARWGVLRPTSLLPRSLSRSGHSFVDAVDRAAPPSAGGLTAFGVSPAGTASPFPTSWLPRLLLRRSRKQKHRQKRSQSRAAATTKAKSLADPNGHGATRASHSGFAWPTKQPIGPHPRLCDRAARFSCRAGRACLRAMLVG